jgi:hypothetical protein
MPQQSANLNTDLGNIYASSEYGDRGDGTSSWYTFVKVRDVSAKAILKLEDAAHASGDAGVMLLAVRSDTFAALAGTTGDYIPLTTDSVGRLWVSGTVLEDAAHASGDAGHFVLGVQSLTRTSRSADGDYTPVAVDAAGAQFVAAVPEGNSAWALSSYNAVAAASGVIKASAGKLYGITFYTEAAQYLQLFNTTSVPADTTVPHWSVKLAANGSLRLSFADLGRYFSTGICWSNSSTHGTKTIGSADCSVIAEYL